MSSVDYKSWAAKIDKLQEQNREAEEFINVEKQKYLESIKKASDLIDSNSRIIRAFGNTKIHANLEDVIDEIAKRLQIAKDDLKVNLDVQRGMRSLVGGYEDVQRELDAIKRGDLFGIIKVYIFSGKHSKLIFELPLNFYDRQKDGQGLDKHIVFVPTDQYRYKVEIDDYRNLTIGCSVKELMSSSQGERYPYIVKEAFKAVNARECEAESEDVMGDN